MRAEQARRPGEASFRGALAIDKSVRAGAQEARARLSRGLLGHSRRAEFDPGAGEVQGAVGLGGRASPARGRGQAAGGEERVGAADQDAPAVDPEQLHRPPARGRVAVDGDSRGRGGRCAACECWATTSRRCEFCFPRCCRSFPRSRRRSAWSSRCWPSRAPSVRPIIFEKLKERRSTDSGAGAVAGAGDRADHGDQPGRVDAQQPERRGGRSGA